MEAWKQLSTLIWGDREPAVTLQTLMVWRYDHATTGATGGKPRSKNFLMSATRKHKHAETLGTCFYILRFQNSASKVKDRQPCSQHCQLRFRPTAAWHVQSLPVHCQKSWLARLEIDMPREHIQWPLDPNHLAFQPKERRGHINNRCIWSEVIQNDAVSIRKCQKRTRSSSWTCEDLSRKIN